MDEIRRGRKFYSNLIYKIGIHERYTRRITQLREYG